jgi:excisionase family DNA binding protein
VAKPTKINPSKIMNAVVSSPTNSAPVLGAFTLPQVARMLSVSKRTIEREIERGRLKVVRIGRCVRIKPDDLAAYSSGLGSSGS